MSDDTPVREDVSTYEVAVWLCEFRAEMRREMRALRTAVLTSGDATRQNSDARAEQITTDVRRIVNSALEVHQQLVSLPLELAQGLRGIADRIEGRHLNGRRPDAE